MTILITGGSGFLGSELAGLLIEKEGAQPVLFDLLPNEDVVADISASVTVVRGDFSEATEVTRALRDYEITDIFHLGYFTAESETFPSRAIRTNCSGTNTLFECALVAGVRRVVWASSAAVYGTGTTSADPTWHVESDPVAPKSIYGACKLFNEHIAEMYAMRQGFDHVALRFCAIFGAGRGSRRGIGRDFYSSFLDDGSRGQPIEAPPADHVVTWGYVKDAAAALYAAYSNPSPPHRIYNVAGPSTTVAEAAEVAKRHFPSSEMRFASAGLRHLGYVNADRLKQELGWVPAFDAESGVLDYLSKNRSVNS